MIVPNTVSVDVPGNAEPKPTLTTVYDRLRPLIIWLGMTELSWIGWWLLTGGTESVGYSAAVAFWIGSMLVWTIGVSIAAWRGWILKYAWLLSNHWGLSLVIAFAVLLFASVPAIREGVWRAAQSTSDAQLAGIHVLRLLAVGTIIKYLHKELPLHFVIFGSIPDLLFGISAVIVTAAAASQPFSATFLVVWHAVGLSAFLGAGFAMYFSVESPLRIFHGRPDTSIVFQFPMVLAPNLTVPLLMIAHLFALLKLLG